MLFVETMTRICWHLGSVFLVPDFAGYRINPCHRIPKNADFHGVVSAKSALNCQSYTITGFILDMSAESEGLRAQKNVCSVLASLCTVTEQYGIVLFLMNIIWVVESFRSFQTRVYGVSVVGLLKPSAK